MVELERQVGEAHPTQHIGGTILVVMMEVEQGHEEEFNRWYNDEHLPQRLEIPGYVSARRFKLEEGEGVLQYLCIWELEDASPLESELYKPNEPGPANCETRRRHISGSGPGAFTTRFSPWRALSKTTRAIIPTQGRDGRIRLPSNGKSPTYLCMILVW